MKPHRLANFRHQQGVTLVEQVLVGLIVVTLGCMAAPALAQLLRRNRLQTAQLDLVSTLHHARALAATTGRRTMLCPTRDGQRCADELHWENGWLIGHYDTNQKDQPDGSPLFTGQHHDQITIVSTAGRRRVRFQNDGSAKGSNLTFTLCHRGRTEGALAVAVSNAGRIKNSTVTAEQARGCASAGEAP